MRAQNFRNTILEVYDDSDSSILSPKREQTVPYKSRHNFTLTELVQEMVSDSDTSVEENEQEFLQEMMRQYQTEAEKLQIQPTLVLVQMNEIRAAEEYIDALPLLKIRKGLYIFVTKFKVKCKYISESIQFQWMSMIIVFLQSVLIAVNLEHSVAESIFLYYYTLEMLLQLIGLGIIMPRDAYFRDFWNYLNFAIIIITYLTLYGDINVSISSLRVARIFKVIQNIKIRALNQIIQALVKSILQLKDAMIFLLFTYILFALMGLSLFQGYLKYRCMSFETGIVMNPLAFCNECSGDRVCVKTISNPKFYFNFDTFGWSLLQVYQITTMEGWSEVMGYMIEATNYFVVIYYITIILVGGFFLVNLMLAIIKMNFSNSKHVEKTIKVQEYNYWEMRKLGIYVPKRIPVKAKYGCTMITQSNYTPKARKSHRATTSIRSIMASKSSHGIPIDRPTLRLPGFTDTFKVRNLVFQGIQGVNTKKIDAQKKLQQNPVRSPSKHSSSIFNSSPSKRQDQLPKMNLIQTQIHIERSPVNSNHVPTPRPRASIESIHERQFIEEQNLPSMNRLASMDDAKHSELSIVHSPSIDASKQLIVNYQRAEGRRNTQRVTSQGSFLRIPEKRLTAKSFTNMFEEVMTKEQNQVLTRINDFERQSVTSIEIDKKMFELGLDVPIKVKVPHKMPQRKSKKRNFIILNQETVTPQQQQMKNQLYRVKFQPKVTKQKYISTSHNDILKIIEPKDSQHHKKQIRYEFKNAAMNICMKSKSEEQNCSTSVQSKQSRKSRSQSMIKSKKAIQRQKKVRQFSYVSFKIKKEIQPIVQNKEFDLQSDYNHMYKSMTVTQASMEDVLAIPEYHYYDDTFLKQMESIIRGLNYTPSNYQIYLEGLTGKFNIFRKYCLLISNSVLFSRFVNIIVAANTIVLSLNGLVNSNGATLTDLNIFFISVYIFEFFLKIFGQGVSNFVVDRWNVFDACIVVISLLELFLTNTSGQSSLSVLKAIRLLRALRVLRISKLLRSLKFMRFILKVLGNAFSQLVYLILLLLILIYIYTLLGMTLFNDQIHHSEERYTFQSFYDSFQRVFQIMTIIFWQKIMYDLLESGVPIYETLVYLISWITIGNQIFLSLLLAIMLDNFESEYRNDKKQIDNKMVIAQDDIFSEKNSSKSQKSRQSKTSIQMPEFNNKSQINFVYFIENNIADKSLYLFSQENIIRRFCYRVVKHTYFDRAILMVIFISTIKLIIETYSIPEDISTMIDILVVCLFGVEALMKVIAYGFAIDSSSYLRDEWNVLDFIIIVFSLVDVSVSSINLRVIKVFRLVRTLRPLRFISQNRSLKLIVSALLQSRDGLMNVGLIIILTWLIFAIVAMNFLMGKLNYCKLYTGEHNYFNQEECIGVGTWSLHHTNFENVFSGMLTLFILSTQVGWPAYLLQFQDGTDSGPVKDANPSMFWFFVIFIIIGSILLMNLFIGVILVNFHIAEESSRAKYLTKEQHKWINTQKLITSHKPNFSLYYCPKNRLRSICFQVVKYKYFNQIITFNIICSIIITAMYQDGKIFIYLDASPEYTSTLDLISYVFSVILFVEASVKILAFSPIGYFRHQLNQLDFAIAVVSVLELIINISDIKIGKIFRILRILRLIRLIKQFSGMKKLIDTAIYSIPPILNAAMLYFLVHTIFSILGVFLFQSIEEGEIIDSLNNFSNFHQAFVILFRCQTGEEWYEIMFDTMHSIGWYACFFWIAFIIAQKFIMMNLFILIIIDQYEQNYFHEDNPLNRFEEYVMIFTESWTKFSEDGEVIHQDLLIKFLFQLKEPLGIDSQNSLKNQLSEWEQNNPYHTDEVKDELKRKIRSQHKLQATFMIFRMELLADPQGYIDYYQVLFRTLRESYINKIKINLNVKGAYTIRRKEEETLNSIINYKFNTNVNTITAYLFSKLAFRAWKTFSQKFARAVHKEFIEFESSSVEFVSDIEANNSPRSMQSLSNLNEEEYIKVPDTSLYTDQL